MVRRPASDPNRKNTRRGSAAIEFALVMICAIPLLFGTVAMGITIGRAVEAIQVSRDVGHMYSLGVDFTSASAQQLAAQLGQGFDLSSSGNAVLIFSEITTVFQADCNAASMSTQCTNVGQPVFMQRIVIGNSSLKTSAFGTPPSQYINAQGNISSTDYFQQSSLVANGFSSIITQNDGDVAYVVEGFFTMPDLNFLAPGFLQSNSVGGMYARGIF